MKIPFKMSILGVMLASVAASATAQTILKSGSLTLHTAYKGEGDAHQVTDSRLYWFGTWLGISYNSAPLSPSSIAVAVSPATKCASAADVAA